MSIFKKLRLFFFNVIHINEYIRKIIKEELVISHYDSLSNESFNIGVINEEYCEYPIIISLTTYGKRIYDVYLTIESLMQQTMKPNKIILWLAKDEFRDDLLPISLKKLKKRGLTISYCEDLRSFKKLIPTLEIYPNAIIITTDDDVIYSKDLVENFYNSYKEDDACVYFNRGHKITFEKNGVIKKYLEWSWEVNTEDKSLLYVPTGNAGVMYPPNCFYKDVINRDIFLKLCPTTDDIWFKAMSLKNGVLNKKCKGLGKYFEIETVQENSLRKTNKGLGINDKSIKAVFEKYDLNELLK